MVTRRDFRAKCLLMIFNAYVFNVMDVPSMLFHFLLLEVEMKANVTSSRSMSKSKGLGTIALGRSPDS